MIESTRRRALAAIAAGTVGVGGCLGSDGDAEEELYGDWFATANNFEGTVDRTGTDETTVLVGAPSGFAFDPAAIRVDAGTTVVWEWTGDGGRHDVAEEDGAFESDLADEAGYTFSHAFDDAGVYRYACRPHQTSGMVGAVDVID